LISESYLDMINWRTKTQLAYGMLKL